MKRELEWSDYGTALDFPRVFTVARCERGTWMAVLTEQRELGVSHTMLGHDYDSERAARDACQRWGDA